MSTSTRITRSKGESDGLSLPMRMRLTRRDTTSGRNGGRALSTSGREHQQQMPTQMPHLTHAPEAASAERTTTAPMLPPGPHRPLTPHMPLPSLPTSSPRSSAPLFQECKVPIMQGAFYGNYANLYWSPCSGIFVRLLHTERALFFGECL